MKKFNQTFTDEELKAEIWKPIEGYEGTYSVSSLGRVRSEAREIMRSDGQRQPIKVRILRPAPDRRGYLIVSLYNNGQQTHKVHRLVAKAFLENPDEKPQINHINEIKTDNRTVNLEWCTPAVNQLHGGCTTRVRNTRNRRQTAKAERAVQQISLKGAELAIYRSTSEAPPAVGGNQGSIHQACSGKQNTAYGYIWRFIELYPEEHAYIFGDFRLNERGVESSPEETIQTFVDRDLRYNEVLKNRSK